MSRRAQCWTMLVFVLGALAAGPAAAQLSMPSLGSIGVGGASVPITNPASMLQWECYQLVITPCVCPGWPPRPCLRYTYWEPTLLINTQAFTTQSSTGQVDSRFHESRVWPFPVRLVDPAGCLFPCKAYQKMMTGGTSGYELTPFFLSDIDPLWRTLGDIPGTSLVGGLLGGGLSPGRLLDAATGGLMGTWGSTAPRSGWSATSASDPLASAQAMYRSVSVSGDPGGHVVLNQLPFGANLLDNINLGYPTVSHCMKPGFPVATWETGAGSPTGHYDWVWWRLTSCCLDMYEVCKGPVGQREENRELCRMALKLREGRAS